MANEEIRRVIEKPVDPQEFTIRCGEKALTPEQFAKLDELLRMLNMYRDPADPFRATTTCERDGRCQPLWSTPCAHNLSSCKIAPTTA